MGSELDILEFYRDAKIGKKIKSFCDYCSFQESYIEMLIDDLEGKDLLDWDYYKNGYAITEKGLDYINKTRPYKSASEETDAQKKVSKRYY